MLHRKNRVSTKPPFEAPLNIGKAESSGAMRARLRHLKEKEAADA